MSESRRKNKSSTIIIIIYTCSIIYVHNSREQIGGSFMSQQCVHHFHSIQWKISIVNNNENNDSYQTMRVSEIRFVLYALNVFNFRF